jgi:enoyl-CoA hydratase/carnithine racemase
MNAFNLAMLRELSEAYTAYEQDPELRCLLLTAHGDHFTAGLDLAEVAPTVAEGQPLFPEGNIDPLDLWEPRRTKPVVIAVHGWCLTMGVELCLASDIRLAAADTRFKQMEVQRGIMTFGGGTLRWPGVAGWGDAMRWLLTGDEFDAAEAHRIGVVQELVAGDLLFGRALWIAQRVAAQAPLAVRATRANAMLAMERGHPAAKAVLMTEARTLFDSWDAGEGVRSFVQRRAAKFEGR